MTRKIIKDTISTDRKLWISMLNSAKELGWTVRVVSFRNNCHWAELYKVIDV